LPTENYLSLQTKETVIVPLLEKNLGVICFTLDDFETDNLGTFSGGKEENDPLDITLNVIKVEHIQIAPSCTNEGSFGGHPSLLFADADDELLMFKDYKTI
jgi:hypothetical protein